MATPPFHKKTLCIAQGRVMGTYSFWTLGSTPDLVFVHGQALGVLLATLNDQIGLPNPALFEPSSGDGTGRTTLHWPQAANSIPIVEDGLNHFPLLVVHALELW